ncbi:MAG: ferritin [Thermoleophilia bacterium]|nr:ferritin [Thermoleophilia bacterium]
MIIDQDVADALNIHMGREFSAHTQYLAISAWFAEEGLPELARLFAAQAAEEHAHAMKFYHYIIDAGAPLRMPAIEAPKPAFESAEDAVALALDQELAVTRQINEIADLAAQRRDHATQVFLQWFITEQVEEVATMGELRQVVGRAGEQHLLLVEQYAARRMAGEAAGEDS